MAQENKAVWVFSELPALSFELLAKGRTLADLLGTKLTAVSFGRCEWSRIHSTWGRQGLPDQ